MKILIDRGFRYVPQVGKYIYSWVVVSESMMDGLWNIAVSDTKSYLCETNELSIYVDEIINFEGKLHNLRWSDTRDDIYPIYGDRTLLDFIRRSSFFKPCDIILNNQVTIKCKYVDEINKWVINGKEVDLVGLKQELKKIMKSHDI